MSNNKQLRASKNLYFANEEIGMIDTQNTSMDQSFEKEGAGTDVVPNNIFANSAPIKKEIININNKGLFINQIIKEDTTKSLPI